MDTQDTFDDEDDFDPVEAERQIGEFIAAADTLPGPPVLELAAGAGAVLAAAWEQLERIVGDQPNNKVVATMLYLSREARELVPEDPRQWQLHAASSLVGAMIPNARH